QRRGAGRAADRRPAGVTGVRRSRHAVRSMAVLSADNEPGRLTMTARSPRPSRKLLVVAGTAIAFAAALLVGMPVASAGPCDIYGSGGTPCVAAHSTTRALFNAYNGPLYQVRRASDNATTNIGVLTTGGFANAAAQDSFCANTTCVITIIFDQT